MKCIIKILDDGEVIAMNFAAFNISMEIILAAQVERDYNLYAQLYGYL